MATFNYSTASIEALRRIATRRPISPDRVYHICYTIFARELQDGELFRKALALPHLEERDLLHLAEALSRALSRTAALENSGWAHEVLELLVNHPAASEELALTLSASVGYTALKISAEAGWLSSSVYQSSVYFAPLSSSEKLHRTAELAAVLDGVPRARRLAALLGYEWNHALCPLQTLANLCITLAETASEHGLPQELEGYQLLEALAAAPLTPAQLDVFVRVAKHWQLPSAAQTVLANLAKFQILDADQLRLLNNCYVEKCYERWPAFESALMSQPLFGSEHALVWAFELATDFSEFVEVCLVRRWAAPLVKALLDVEEFPTSAGTWNRVEEVAAVLDPLLKSQPRRVWEVALTLAPTWGSALDDLPALVHAARGITAEVG